MHVLNKFALELFNVKRTKVDGNYFGVAMDVPVIYYDYDEKVGSSCDRDDLSASDVNNTFENNVKFVLELIFLSVHSLKSIFSAFCNFLQ